MSTAGGRWPLSKLTLKKFRQPEMRKTSFNFRRKFYFNAEQNEAAREPRTFVLHLYFAVQTILCSGRLVTYQC